MKIRKAAKKDIPELFDILIDNNSNYPKKIALRELNEMFSDALFRPTYLVCEDGNNIFGFGGFAPSWIDNMVVNMFWVNVAPEFQGRGIGKKLIEGLIREIEKLKKPNAKMILISTDIPEFYEKFGFEEMGTKYDGYYVLMGRKI